MKDNQCKKKKKGWVYGEMSETEAAEWRKSERKKRQREQGNVIFSLTLWAFASLRADAQAKWLLTNCHARLGAQENIP